MKHQDQEVHRSFTNKDRLIASVGTLLPVGITEAIRKNILNSVRLAFENLEFVTREEIEIQEQVLRRAHLKIRELEQRISVLELEAEQYKTSNFERE